MPGIGREVADLMGRRKMGVLCIQETRSKGNKATELRGEYEGTIIDGDFNGHIWTNNEFIAGVRGGFGSGHRDGEGEKVIDFALVYDLAISNTFFKKDYNEYKSGGRETQIDFILYRRRKLNEVKICKVIKRKSVCRHHVVIVEFKIKQEESERITVRPENELKCTELLISAVETWPERKAQVKRMNVTEMRMLKWMCGITLNDKIRNETIRRDLVKDIGKKVAMIWTCVEGAMSMMLERKRGRPRIR
ncbi:uncharacterized protein LOC134773413 [Penaeus indicus]|uniref:uncharacterized protein LOC134773413 n=1 Tax=Penaeus indicus TaxID=29960 RepID=UPI00300C7915